MYYYLMHLMKWDLNTHTVSREQLQAGEVITSHRERSWRLAYTPHTQPWVLKL